MEKHFAEERREFVSLFEHCLGYPAFEYVVVLGVPTGQGASATQPVLTMLGTQIQATIRGLFVIVDDLFRSGYCLKNINSGTFVVDNRTGVPLLSAQGRWDIVPISNRTHAETNVRELAALLRNSVLRSGSAPVPVQEVEDGLLRLMETQGWTAWPAIMRHPSLLPLENRLTYHSRLHTELVKVLCHTHPGKCLNVLRWLNFPSDWHSRAKNNNIMKKMYMGRSYNTVDTSHETQAWEILRFTRNGDQHGPDHAVAPGSTEPDYRGHHIAAIFAFDFPMLLHSLLVGMHWEGQLENVSLDTLFCYPPK